MESNLADGEAHPDVYKRQVLSRIILLDETGAELGSSGLLKPGEYVQSVALERIPPKSSSILAKILSYEPQTYYSMGSASAEIYLHIV